jgi:osmotically-inducible protein OsmY
MSGISLIYLITKSVSKNVLDDKQTVMNTTQQTLVDLSPQEIKEKIRSVFAKHALVDSQNISVKATGRTVVLTGKVRSWTERKDAEDAAWSMPGVMEVENNLAVEGEIDAGE